MKDIEERIDALYQLPLGEFTAARTALARSLAKEDAARVKKLQKPTAIPWLVNQLYWRAHPVFEQLQLAGRALRAAQIAALEGHSADVRKATDAHRSAVAAAVRRSAAFAAEAGLGSTAEPVARMLEAVSLAPLPPEHPGRFTEVIHPAAFEALAGVNPDFRSPSRRLAASDGLLPKTAGRDTEDADAAERRAQAAAERVRSDAMRAERRRIDDELKKADRLLTAARDQEADARTALKRAESDVRAAEAAIATLKARRDALAG